MYTPIAVFGKTGRVLSGQKWGTADNAIGRLRKAPGKNAANPGRRRVPPALPEITGRYWTLRRTMAEFLLPKAMQFATACSMAILRPASGM